MAKIFPIVLLMEEMRHKIHTPDYEVSALKSNEYLPKLLSFWYEITTTKPVLMFNLVPDYCKTGLGKK